MKKAVIGYLRAIEVTYNAERDDYHPHIHIVV
ncbi:protein rep [Streptococcus alactolyticus]